MNFQIAPGVFDILPKDSKDLWRSIHLWHHLESTIRQLAHDYGFQEIRTPIFERTELFQRGVGETSDVVSKEMYTFEDRGGRSMSLRPEGTAPAMRSFIENQLFQNVPFNKFYYICPMFRYERAQAGRYRQHHQFGVEAIGNSAPEQDVELIDMLYTLYNRLGLKNLTISISSLGNTESRIIYRKVLQDYFKQYLNDLSTDSKTRLETNPLRILDSKDPKDIEIAKNAPSVFDFLNDECRDHFNEVQKLLKSLNIPFQVNKLLVRGLDYYNKTVFEIVAGELGAQNSLAGGGRYDGLVKSLGGPDLPATGFGMGMERTLQTMLKQEVPLPNPYAPEVFLIALGEEAKGACFKLLHDLRQKGISTQMEFTDRKINKQMQYANQIQAAHVLVIGENELKTKHGELKDMATSEKRSLPLDCIADILCHEKQNSCFLASLAELSKPYVHPAEADFFLNRLDDAINETMKVTENLKKALTSLNS